MIENMEIFYQALSPFVAGVVASMATYYFAIRTKRHEVIDAERLTAFKMLNKKIVSLKKYCMVKEMGNSGCELGPTLESLGAEANKSIMVHRTEIWTIVEENGIFLSKKSRKVLQDLDSQLSLLCSMELCLADSNPLKEVVSSAPEGYRLGANIAESCLDALFDELKYP